MSEFLPIFHHAIAQKHDTGPHHPESSARVEAILSALKSAPFASRLRWETVKPVETEWIERIHSPEYRQFIEEASLSGKHTVDHGETIVCPESYDAARHAAGAACQAVDTVLNGIAPRAFSLMRPPGHHARSEQAMGFCLFNNIAIAAHYAKSAHGLNNICIVDWDVHHGNGTQETFYNSPAVLFFSIHQLPLYPHTGEFHETGAGPGKGFTINAPVKAGATLDDYFHALEEDLKPVLRRYHPELILLSAGFDAHAADPLASVQLQSEDFYRLTRWLCREADTHCQGRLVSILEGGYDLQALAESATAHVRALLEN